MCQTASNRLCAESRLTDSQRSRVKGGGNPPQCEQRLNQQAVNQEEGHNLKPYTRISAPADIARILKAGRYRSDPTLPFNDLSFAMITIIAENMGMNCDASR